MKLQNKIKYVVLVENVIFRLGSFSIALAAEMSFETVALYELVLKFAQIFYVKFKRFYKVIFEPLITAILSFF